jgi:23S rRNA pseudouridine2605 synthase
MRLNKYLAHYSGLSRRKADEAIEDGRVDINGEKATVGQTVDDNDLVKFDGETIKPSENYTYLLFNKPFGLVTSRERQGRADTIYGALEEKYHNLKPVGRLDKETTGLLLLTDDGDYSNQLSHPSNHKQKVYQIELDKLLRKSDLDLIQGRGVELRDGKSKMKVSTTTSGKPRYEIKIAEGRNRQIRRTFEHLDYEIISLHRTEFGPYKLNKLPAGGVRQTTKN